MDFLEELKDTAIDLAQSGVNKSRQLAEIARLNLANTAEESAIRKAYQEIGRLYYAERGMAPEAAYAALCEKITASRTTIEENKARIAQVKAAPKENAPEEAASEATTEEATEESAGEESTRQPTAPQEPQDGDKPE